MRKLADRQAGFSLVELMAVVIVSGLLLSGMWRIYHGSIRVYQRGLQEVRSTLAARLALRIMIRDIQQAFASGVSYGIRGTDRQGTPPDAADELELATAAVVEEDGSARHIRYQLVAASQGDTLSLNRTAMAAGGGAPERITSLSERLEGLNLRYFDGQVWYDTWQREQLPQALEITAVFQNPGRSKRVYSFTTVVAAP